MVLGIFPWGTPGGCSIEITERTFFFQITTTMCFYKEAASGNYSPSSSRWGVQQALLLPAHWSESAIRQATLTTPALLLQKKMFW